MGTEKNVVLVVPSPGDLVADPVPKAIFVRHRARPDGKGNGFQPSLSD
jgi:hypothetical protein